LVSVNEGFFESCSARTIGIICFRMPGEHTNQAFEVHWTGDGDVPGRREIGRRI
jgi:hypothetical protein